MENQAQAPASKNKGGRPRKKLDMAAVLKSPEIQALLAETARAAAAEAVRSLGAVASGPVASSDGTSPAWANQLAVALGQVADPRKKPLDPAVIQRRQESRDRMWSLIKAAEARGDVPEYELTRECYLEEQLIPATYIGSDRVVRRQVIGWSKVPNQAMVPVNTVAAEIHAAYLESVGGIVTEGKTPEVARGGHLKVYQDGKLQSIPEARTARGGGTGALSLRGHSLPGQVVETAVLGTVHPAARQIA